MKLPAWISAKHLIRPKFSSCPPSLTTYKHKQQLLSSGWQPAILDRMRHLTKLAQRHRAPFKTFQPAICLAAVTAAALWPGSTVFAATASNATVAVREPATPSTPREFFNAGTRELSAGKFREAEAFLEAALASQNERLQTPALYNLGHVRFEQGKQELKKGPSKEATANLSESAEQQGAAAIRAADEALESTTCRK